MKKKISFVLAFWTVGILAVFGTRIARRAELQRELAAQVVRLRILANSSSEKDQELKLKVRDDILKAIEPIVEGADGKLAVCAALENHMAELENCAARTIRENGGRYTAALRLKQTDFPDKSYGNYFFPSGRYHALVIEIGKAKGKNWWCMLYPALCFQDALQPVVSPTQEKVLQKVLPEDIYEELTKEKVQFSFFWKRHRK